MPHWRKNLTCDYPHASSGGNSKSIRLPRKPRVLIAPNAMPTTIQIPPTIQAFQLRFFHKKKQIVNPASGGLKIAKNVRPRPATTQPGQPRTGQSTSAITTAVTSSGNIGL